MLEFKAWPKTPRFFRDIVITEKIDGTNAAVIVQRNDETGEVEVGAQSRKRIITPDADNFGFARWVETHKASLAVTLGEGYHYGEWWGSGIQRGYGLTKGEKRFSLFNVHRYGERMAQLRNQFDHPLFGQVDVVPTLYTGPMSTYRINRVLDDLELCGSQVAPGFDRPEGIVIFHSASGQVYKSLLEGDEHPKGAAA